MKRSVKFFARAVLLSFVIISLFILITGPDGCNPCAPQKARGSGACTLVLGVYWNGVECEYVSGCSCIGRDCNNGFETIEECEEAYAEILCRV